MGPAENMQLWLNCKKVQMKSYLTLQMNAKTLFTRVLPFKMFPATECHLVVRSKAISKHNWPILHPVMMMMMMMMMSIRVYHWGLVTCYQTSKTLNLGSQQHSYCKILKKIAFTLIFTSKIPFKVYHQSITFFRGLVTCYRTHHHGHLGLVTLPDPLSARKRELCANEVK